MKVLQSSTGAGQIILDEGTSAGTALSGNGGTVSLTAGTGGKVLEYLKEHSPQESADSP